MKDSLQLKPPNNLNINNLKHNSFYNHQLKIDSITNNNNNINNHLKVNNIDSNINIDISSNNGDIKDNIKPIFEPPKIITPIDEIIQIDLPIDSAEDEAPVDESTQTEVEIPQPPQELSPPELIIPPVNIQLKPKPKPGPIGNGGENAIGDELNPVESAPNTKPEPKSKPIPKEKPAPQNSDQQTSPPPPPLDSAVPPKPKPQPRSLLSLLGFEDGPKNLKPKPKPIPKGKPAPPAPVLGRNSPPVPPGKLPPAPPTTTTRPPTEPAQTQTQIGMFPSFGETMSFGLSYKSNENTKLHAQMNLLSSPHSVDYSDEAYIKIQAIQDYCSVDYATYCTSMMSDIFGSELSTSSNSNIMPFGNWEGDDDQVDNENTFFFVGFINSIFDVFNNMIGTSEEDSSNGFIAIDFADLDVNDEVRDDDESTPQPPCTRGQMKFPVTPSIPSLSPQSPGVNMHQIQPFMIEPRNRLLHGFHHSHDSHDSEIGEDPITEKEHRQFHPYPKPRPEDARQRPEHLGRPEDVHHRPEHGFHGKHMGSSSSGSSSSSDSSSSSGSVDNFFFSKPHPLEFPRNFAEAPLTFLGYGTEGDMCLLSNLDSLSIPCQNAIDDAFVLHDQYTMEEENGKGCAFIAGMAGMLLVLTTFVCCKRFYLRPRREQTMKTLNAIHNDPELKSRVEAATGFPVPKPCMLQENGNENQPCRGKQCVTVILRCMITFALSFLLVRVAAEITIAIANNMIYTNEDGETIEPTPIVVLLIFISFLLVELLIVVGIKKCVRSYVARRQRNSIATSGTNSNIPPTTSSSSSNGGGFGRYFVLPNIPLPTRRFSLFRSNSSNGYSPLMTDEENTVTEMIQSPSIVVASAPSQHQVLYVPPSTVNVHPHVTAQSISSVSML